MGIKGRSQQHHAREAFCARPACYGCFTTTEQHPSNNYARPPQLAASSLHTAMARLAAARADSLRGDRDRRPGGDVQTWLVATISPLKTLVPLDNNLVPGNGLDQTNSGWKRAMTQRRCIKHSTSFEERLAKEAECLKEQAKVLPPGKDRELLLRKARQANTAAHITEWLNSPGLQPPKLP